MSDFGFWICVTIVAVFFLPVSCDTKEPRRTLAGAIVDRLDRP